MQITYMRVQQTIALARLQMKLETAPKGYLDFITLKADTVKADRLLRWEIVKDLTTYLE